LRFLRVELLQVALVRRGSGRQPLEVRSQPDLVVGDGLELGLQLAQFGLRLAEPGAEAHRLLQALLRLRARYLTADEDAHRAVIVTVQGHAIDARLLLDNLVRQGLAGREPYVEAVHVATLLRRPPRRDELPVIADRMLDDQRPL